MKIRLNITYEAKMNFQGKYQDTKCSVGCDAEETTEHIQCTKIRKVTGHKMTSKDIGEDMKKTEWQKEAAKGFKLIEEMKNSIWIQ